MILPVDRAPTRPLAASRNAKMARSGNTIMAADWNILSDDLQLTLARAALYKAAETIAGQAEVLASEMETGGLADQGGPDALRLLARVVRLTGQAELAMAGHA